VVAGRGRPGERRDGCAGGLHVPLGNLHDVGGQLVADRVDVQFEPVADLRGQFGDRQQFVASLAGCEVVRCGAGDVPGEAARRVNLRDRGEGGDAGLAQFGLDCAADLLGMPERGHLGLLVGGVAGVGQPPVDVVDAPQWRPPDVLGGRRRLATRHVRPPCRCGDGASSLPKQVQHLLRRQVLGVGGVHRLLASWQVGQKPRPPWAHSGLFMVLRAWAMAASGVAW
jgi:hypothetical protein